MRCPRQHKQTVGLFERQRQVGWLGCHTYRQILADSPPNRNQQPSILFLN